MPLETLQRKKSFECVQFLKFSTGTNIFHMGHLQALPALNVPRSYCGVGASSEKNSAGAVGFEGLIIS